MPIRSRRLAAITPRLIIFAALLVLAVCVLWTPLAALVELALRDERYTFILGVPFISAALVYREMGQIQAHARYCPAVGIPVMLLGLTVYFASGRAVSLTPAPIALAMICIGAFISCFGLIASRAASFALGILFLIVPAPPAMLDRFAAALQAGSASLSYLLFRAVGVPVLRHGMVLSLPGVDIGVAPQCSGIRSTTALFLVGLAMCPLLLRTSWTRLLLILCIIPIAIFRNTVRIVTISLLGVYVNRAFLFGDLHKHGGIPFSLVGFALLIPLVWLLSNAEQALKAGPIHTGAVPALKVVGNATGAKC